MKIETDSLVTLYLQRSLYHLIFADDSDLDLVEYKITEKMQERILMDILSSMVARDAVHHHFDSRRRVDEFHASER